MRLGYPLATAATLLIGACSIGKPIPTATTYCIESPAAMADAGGPVRPERLRVGRVRVAAPYDGPALVYRLSVVRYVSDPYHAFLSDPGPMLGNSIAAWLDQAQLFKTAAGPERAPPAPLVLEASVMELYGDFEQNVEPAAVMSVRFTVVDQASARPQIAYERTITRRIRLADSSPDELVRGYGTALAEILSLLAADLTSRRLSIPEQ
jgi:uncharacterized lipoprotein YmbA